jgi:hypothetical protein
MNKEIRNLDAGVYHREQQLFWDYLCEENNWGLSKEDETKWMI